MRNLVPTLLAMSLFAAGATAVAARPSRARTAARVVVGSVIDAGTRQPLPNVQVIVSGLQVGSQTRANGQFGLRAVPDTAVRIEFRHPCYFAVQVSIPGAGDTEIDVGLPFDQASLQRMGCGGLGARSRRDTTVDAPAR